MPARVSWQELLKAQKNQGGNDGASSTDKAQGSLPATIRKTSGSSLTLHMLLKSANPSWSTAEFKAAKKKLKTIGIESYSDLEEVLLEGNGILNNRLRDNGLKAFSASTLDRLKSAVLAEQEKLRQAAEQAEALAEKERMRLAAEKAKEEYASLYPTGISRVIIKPLPMMGRPRAHQVQDCPRAQQPDSPSNKTLYMLLKNANPGWTTKDIDSAMKKLKKIGIVTYMELEEVVLQGRGILNKRLKDNGLRIFAPSTLQRLKNTVKPETPRLPRSPCETKKSHPLVPSFDLGSPCEAKKFHSFDLGSPCGAKKFHSFDLGSPSDAESTCFDTPSRRDSDTESMDDCMRWYDDSDSDVSWRMVERRLSEMSSSSCKVKIAPLDLSKVNRMSGAHESQYSSRTESTAIGTSPPTSPFAPRAATFFSIGTP